MKQSTCSSLVSIAAVLASPSSSLGAPWEVAKETDDILVLTREVESSDIKEVRVVGTLPARPQSIFAVLADVEAHTRTLPFYEVSRVLRREGHTTWIYTVLNPPLVSRRDYAWKQEISRGNGNQLRIAWELANHLAPPLSDGFVRMTVNSGEWVIDSAGDGSKSHVEYRAHMDPGGSMPKWMVNMGAASEAVEMFSSLKKAAARPEYENAADPFPQGLAADDASHNGTPPATTPVSAPNEPVPAPSAPAPSN